MAQLEQFNDYRPLLFAIAYRMLGSVMDAEDIVQEAFLRWRQADTAAVQSPKAFLTTVVTRLCIDQLRLARTQREQYVGPWLPEPLLTDRQPDLADSATLVESLSLAFLVLLERLTPTARAVFLLRDIFGYDYTEIASIVGKSEANCRQLARRARADVLAGRPRFTPSREQQQRLTTQFMRACTEGDLQTLVTTLADDITLWSDGGGKVTAARRPIHGADQVARFLLGIIAKTPPTIAYRLDQVNGQPGIVSTVGERLVGVLTLDIAGERIQAIHIVVNPDKLALARPSDSVTPS